MKTVITILVLTLFGFISPSITYASLTIPSLENYQYPQTKQLVDFVYRAAQLFEKEGSAAFPAFSKKDGPWFQGDQYIFIYNPEGYCIFHPVYKQFVGKDLSKIQDLEGKPLLKLLNQTVSNKEHPYGWFHYLWANPDQIFPQWKTAFVIKVKGPDNKIYLIGSGLSNMRMEKVFVEQTTNQAAELLQKIGTKAFEDFQDVTSLFIYNDIYIFVMTMEGIMLVDPALPKTSKTLTLKDRNFINFRDAIGNFTIQTMIDKMKHQNSAWIPYMWQKPGEIKPSRKMAYIKKITVGNKTLIVGSDLFVASPIWLKY